MILIGCQMKTNSSSTSKRIILKSVGEVETVPNLATFYINLNCLDKSIKASKACLVEKSNALQKQLQAIGIKNEDILTALIEMDKSYDWKNDSRVFEGYRSSTKVRVTVRNLNNLDQLYTDLLENSNLELYGLEYAHSKMDSLKNEAYLDALKKADILSDQLLSKMPEKNKEILSLGNVQFSSSPATNRQANFENDNFENSKFILDNQPIMVSKGNIQVQAILYVEYKVK